MPPIRWAQAALREVTRLHDFLETKSCSAAMRAIQAIHQGIQILADHPEVGRPVEDMSPEFREWMIEFGEGAYVVLYRFDGKQVVLLAIRHGREGGY
ncbi:MAG: type II toxin-antitoxin system RelE/ParE family toxin [Terracidiphilus sp.]